MSEIGTKRILHSLGVATKLKEIAVINNPGAFNYHNELFILGLLHDIGYEFTNNQMQHAEVAGEILEKLGYKYWKEVYYHGKSETPYQSIELKMLNIADLQIDADGKEISVKERLEIVKNKYGETSFQYVDFKKLATNLNLI